MGELGCSFGNVEGVYAYIFPNGITSEANYPYTAKKGTFNATNVSKVVAKIIGYTPVLQNEFVALKVAVAQQPTAAAVEADPSSWQFYKSGVVTNNCGTTPDHNIVIVGFSYNTNLSYWICKNSWGQDWGEKGYIRIGMTAGKGVCGINMYPYYPYVEV